MGYLEYVTPPSATLPSTLRYALDGLPRGGHTTSDYVISKPRVCPRLATLSRSRYLRPHHQPRPLKYAFDRLSRFSHAIIDHVVDYDHLSMSPSGSLNGHIISNYVVDCTPSLDSLEEITTPSVTSLTMTVRASLISRQALPKSSLGLLDACLEKGSGFKTNPSSNSLNCTKVRGYYRRYVPSVPHHMEYSPSRMGYTKQATC